MDLHGRTVVSRLLRAGLLTGVSDGLFASVLNVVVYQRTPARLFQGVAAVPLGKEMLNGGLQTAALGLVIHFGVAFAWSAIFLILFLRTPRLRRIVDSRFGVLKVASVYGPFIWLAMSLIVIPVLLQRAPAINSNFWFQLVGHIPFVAVPIVSMIGKGPK